jgi:hypothetical protein
MLGLILRWDYKSNNSGLTKMYPELGDREPVDVGPNLAGRNTAYGYYDESINGLKLGQVTPRFRELIAKATGVDVSDYDGAIVNLYDEDTFIGNHSDLEESATARKYPVVAVNIGGSGNFTAGTTPADSVKLKPGAGYLFGLNGVNRTIPHSTLSNKQDGFLPEITTQLDGRIYPAGSYRITITMRRVMPLTPGMPNAPKLLTTTGTEVNEFTPSTVGGPVVVVTRELRNQLGRLWIVAENNNTEIVTIDGEQFAIIDLSKPKKGYTTFYGGSVEPNVLLKKTGKPIVVPGYEDIKLMVETDKTVIELSTGLSITTKGKSFDAIEKELKQKFEDSEGTEKSVRTLIKEARKLKANNPGVNIVSLTNQRVETANLQENAATLINQQNIDAVNTNPTNVSVTDQIVNQLNQQPEDESQCSVGE